MWFLLFFGAIANIVIWLVNILEGSALRLHQLVYIAVGEIDHVKISSPLPPHPLPLHHTVHLCFGVVSDNDRSGRASSP
jgi:hypothetical protein